MYWFALVIAFLSNIAANAAFKKAVTRLSSENVVYSVFNLLFEPWAWIGGFFAILLLGSYLYALKGLDLSIAYPAVTSLATLGVAAVGILYFNETLTIMKAVGIAMIISGVLLLQQSS